MKLAGCHLESPLILSVVAIARLRKTRMCISAECAGLEASSQKFLEYIQNGCLKEARLSTRPLWGREAAPKEWFAKFGFFEAAVLYMF